MEDNLHSQDKSQSSLQKELQIINMQIVLFLQSIY